MVSRRRKEPVSIGAREGHPREEDEHEDAQDGQVADLGDERRGPGPEDGVGGGEQPTEDEEEDEAHGAGAQDRPRAAPAGQDANRPVEQRQTAQRVIVMYAGKKVEEVK